ncbi:MAG: hypothetical protein JEZ06_23180, partial [Anaerolineaceae bacterium]|nr:hypothetical protein [Anaerolineaceae bacterium]
ARIGVGHGQMPENELAQVMDQFSQGEMDILLCTSIIESGLDIPNANTLIVDRGDTFGLAQLYQLRGRVGRGAQRAYAYFFRHKSKQATLQGLERLETLAENTHLGAGYSIAMRDLEMRGAGELLGNRQHGNIASVGFHLYTKLLSRAVHQFRLIEGINEPLEGEDMDTKILSLPITVELPLSVGIPSDYIPDQKMRLRIYRRLADFGEMQEFDHVEEEFEDRFGPLPEMLQNLIYQSKVKLLAQEAGLISVTMENQQAKMKFPASPDVRKKRFLPEIAPHIRVGKNTYWLQVDDNWKEEILNALSDIIEKNISISKYQ